VIEVVFKLDEGRNGPTILRCGNKLDLPGSAYRLFSQAKRQAPYYQKVFRLAISGKDTSENDL